MAILMTARNLFGLVIILCFISTDALAEDKSWQTEDYKKTLTLGKYVSRGFVHENDTDWIGYGPAIIESRRSVMLGDGASHYFFCEERDPNFPRVKEWLNKPFHTKA